jgi:hypothetical protein
MKKNIFLLAVTCLMIASAGLFAQSRENRNVSGFSKVEFRIAGKLYIRQGNSEKVEIEASKDMLSKIETEVEGSRLIIHTPGTWNWKSDDDNVKVYVTVKNLEALSASGSGDVIGESKFSTNDLDLKVSGSGSLKIDVESSGDIDADVSGSGQLMVSGTSKGFESSVSGSGRTEMKVNVSGKTDFAISGSGKIEAAGRTDDLEISISGSGKVLGANFETNKCDVRISGSGNVEISVKEELDSHISGSGSVSYKGNPSKINNNASGSGTLRKI